MDEELGRPRKTIIMEEPTTLTGAREMLTKLTTSFLAGGISEHTLRTSTYSLNAIIKALVHEKAIELEKRIEVLEKLRAGK